MNTFDVIEASKSAERDSTGLHVSPMIVSNECTIRITAVSIYANGRIFANSSSLCLRWELNGCEKLAFWSDNNHAKKLDGSKWERFLVLQNASGLVGLLGIIHLLIVYSFGFNFSFELYI